MLIVGTHNMHDDAQAVRHADIIGWTEADREAIRGLKGMRHYTRRGPKGLALSWDPRFVRPKRRVRPVTVHRGIRKLTPHRGFLELLATLPFEDNRKVAFLVTHVVNNAFGPIKRKRRRTRRRLWFDVTRRLRRRARRLERRGYLVVIVGDFNRKDFDFLHPLADTRKPGDRPTYDRIFVSKKFVVLSARAGGRYGSDHRVEVARLLIPREE